MKAHRCFLVCEGNTSRLVALAGLFMITAPLGCDTPPEGTDESVANIEASDEEPIAKSPILASIETEDGVTVEFVGVSDDSVGIVVGGPVDLDLRPTWAILRASESPAEALAMLSDDSAAMSPEFVAHSDAVVRSGNWDWGMIRAENLTQRGHAAGESRATEGDAVQDLTAGEAPTESWTCASLWGYGSDLVNQSGNCILYDRYHWGKTLWSWNDGIAFGANVISVTGQVSWKVRHANCNSCNWTQDYHRWVYQGESWFYWTADTNDDFNAESEVINWEDELSQHYHKAVQIHDYRGRTVAGSPGGKAGLMFDSDSLFCTTLNYKGPDPSNIFTSSAWGDIPGWSSCG